MRNLSVEQSLIKAKSYVNKGEIREAQKIYETILKNFSNNLRAQQGLAALKNYKINKNTQCSPQEVFNRLVNLYNQGQFGEVVDQAEALIKQYPKAILIWNILGISRSQIGMFEEAIEAYKKTISLKPDFAEAYCNMGLALSNQGKLEESVEAYKKSILLNPNDADTYFNLGIVLKDQGKFAESIDAYKKSISLKPDFVEAYNNMGTALKDFGMLEDAVLAYKKTLLFKPDHAEAYNNLGICLSKQGKLDESVAAYKKAILLKPDYYESYNNLGKNLNDQGKSKEALQALNKALSLKPDYAEAYNNMGNVLAEQNNLEKAIELFKKALLFKPQDYYVYFNLGNTLHKFGLFEEAETSLKQAIMYKPDFAEAHKNLSFTLLNNGKLKEGLDEIEWRWKTDIFSGQKRNFLQPLWDGKQSLNGKRILIWHEQGVGDTINWSSVLPLVTNRAGHCILECQEKLIPLLKRSFPNVEVKPEDRSRDLKRDDFDYHLPMGSLYKHFLQEITDNSKPDAHLIPNPDRVNHWIGRLNLLGKGPFIGISWKSANMSPIRLPNYSCISEWSQILSIPDITFINLQSKDFADDLAKVREELGVTIHNFDDLDQWNNIDDVAALCSAIDMVICNHGTVPLISGGVGTVTKLANWRQSSWNNILHNPVGPSIDIFERDTLEPWEDVFKLIVQDVSKQKVIIT